MRCLRLAETGVEASDDGECSEEPRDRASRRNCPKSESDRKRPSERERNANRYRGWVAGGYCLELRTRDHREYLKVLIQLQQEQREPGQTWLHASYRASFLSLEVPDWTLPAGKHAAPFFS